MNMPVLVAALASIGMSVIAQFLLKKGVSQVQAEGAAGAGTGLAALASNLANGHLLAGFALYGLGALVWLSVLARWEVSKAYPLVGLGFVFTAVLGAWAGEQVGWMRASGVVLICLGVALVGRS